MEIRLIVLKPSSILNWTLELLLASWSSSIDVDSIIDTAELLSSVPVSSSVASILLYQNFSR